VVIQKIAHLCIGYPNPQRNGAIRMRLETVAVSAGRGKSRI
jgi:hypothetical protein